MRIRTKLLQGLLCVVLLMAGRTAVGQTGRLIGQVTDPQGGTIAGAQVQVVNKTTLVKISVKTDAAGSFSVPYLAPGEYEVEVRAPGFAASLNSDVVLGAAQALVYNVQLTVGPANSSVSVTENSEITQVNVVNSELAGNVTGKEVANLQLNGRNFTQLIALVPGVSNQTQQDEARVGAIGSVAYSVNGGRTEYNSFNVDGSETLNVGINKDHSTLIVYPSVDAIADIKVLTSNYGAEYPSNGNGTTIVTTKSGTNKLHGLLYEFIRNEAFNAKGYFDVTNRAPLYRRQDFGGTIGGPVVIPKFYDGRNKTFFFFSEEARLEQTPTAFRQALPSLEERNGDFSVVCGLSPVDCPNGLLGNHLTVTPAATAILNTGVIPGPNSNTGCNSTVNSCYLADVSLPTYYREELFRLDHALSDSQHLLLRYIHDEWDTTTPVPQYALLQNSFPTIRNRYYGPGTSAVARLTSELPRDLTNELGFSFTLSRIKLNDVAAPSVSLDRPPVLGNAPCQDESAAGDPSGQVCGLGYIFNNGFGGKLPGINIAGNNAEYGGNGFNVDPAYMPWEHSNPSYSISDLAQKTFGHHALSAGGLFTIFQRNQTNGPIGAATGDVQGLLTFNNEAAQGTSGNAFADFLQMGSTSNTGGVISNFQQDSAQGRYHQTYKIFEPFLEDDWKVTPRFTLNAGVRVSVFGVYKEKNHNAYNWTPSAFSRATSEGIVVDGVTGILIDVSTQMPVPIFVPAAPGSSKTIANPRVTNGIVQCGVNGVPDGCMSSHLWNPAPRVGFAWDVHGNGKTAVRAGYGIFFEHGTADEANTGSLEGSAPMVLSMTQNNPASMGCIGNSVAGGCGSQYHGVTVKQGPGAFPLNVTAIPTKAVWPFVQQWSFSIEHELPRNILTTFAYAGSKGTHLTVERELNQLTPTPAANNPFGPHDPLLTGTCSNYNLGGSYNPDSGPGQGYTLPNGQVIAPGSPAFVNMEAACFNHGGPLGGGAIDPAAFRTFAPGLGQIYSLENVANSSYNSFQATERHISGPLTLSVAYTFSHSIDNSSDRSDSTFVNSDDLRQNRASSNYDQRHLLHISYDVKLPLRTGVQHFLSDINTDPDPDSKAPARPPSSYATSYLARLLLDDWHLSGITLFETGIPFTVINGGGQYVITNPPGTTNYPNCRTSEANVVYCTEGVSVLDNAGVYNGVGAGSYPDRVGNPRGHIPKAAASAVNNGASFGPLLLNPGAFAAPRGLTFGNAGRNSLNNPRRWNFDTALHKTVTLHEESTLEFRAEAFNVFNHTQFRIYDPTLGNQANNTVSCYAASAPYSAAGDSSTNCLTGNSFLHPVDAHRPRTIQFGLKLAF